MLVKMLRWNWLHCRSIYCSYVTRNQETIHAFCSFDFDMIKVAHLVCELYVLSF